VQSEPVRHQWNAPIPCSRLSLMYDGLSDSPLAYAYLDVVMVRAVNTNFIPVQGFSTEGDAEHPACRREPFVEFECQRNCDASGAICGEAEC